MRGVIGLFLVCVSIVLVIPNITFGEPLFWFSDYGVSLNLGDDESRLINIGFSFIYYGDTYSQCYANANGSITFSAADDDYTETESEFLNNGPRIAPMWNDFKPVKTTPYNVYMKSLADKLIITWNQLDDYSNGLDNTFQLVLYATGVIQYGYDIMNTPDGITGVSSGDGISANYEVYSGGALDDENLFFEWNGSDYEVTDIPPENLAAVDSWAGY